ncbi:MAG: hypothetical protein II920_09115 [Clostridia bacterium]|nr:hypothetical protein [Clostridia bacterium]
MKLKALILIFIALALSAGALCFAASYGSASSRISFYYQHDGGGRSEPGVWDELLRYRLLAVSGHDQIYYDSSTDRYLTGRGCCLFTFAHAYQYLKGYAGTSAQKADILYEFLSIKPSWSNTGSSLSPPSAHRYYAAYLARQSGITEYSGELDTFRQLTSFFEGRKGAVIVQAPGHYILMIGARTYNGVQYVQVVDSIMSATVRSGRLSYGKSMDFSVTYTPANAALYEASVHEYWLPYSEVVETCRFRHAFRAGSAPHEVRFRLVKDRILLPEGQSYTLELEGDTDGLLFESLRPDICEVDANGTLLWQGEGQASVLITSSDGSNSSALAEVYCVRLPEQPLVIARTGEEVQDPISLDGMPTGTKLSVSAPEATESGLYEGMYRLVDPYGDTVAEMPFRLAVTNEGSTLYIPASIGVIENGAFAQASFDCVVLPASVALVEEGAFDGAPVRLVLAACDASAVDGGAFPEGAALVFDKDVVEAWMWECGR